MARYSKKASDSVKDAVHKQKRGQLKSGASKRTVKSRKQAVAIGLSEARRKGAKVPPPKAGTPSAGRRATRRRSAAAATRSSH